MRTGTISLLALALAGSGALGACSGSSTKSGTPTSRATTTIARTTTSDTPTITWQVTRAKPESVLVGGGHADPAALQRAQAVVDAYLRGATPGALASGRAPASVSALFVPDLTPKVRANTRGALVDSGLGLLRVPATLTGSTRLTALVDGSGKTGAITATVHVHISAITTKGRWRLQRDGELLLLPLGPTWRIAAYDLTLTRTNVMTGATTTASSSTTTTAPGAKP